MILPLDLKPRLWLKEYKIKGRKLKEEYEK